MKTNIFTYKDERGDLVDIFYRLLMTRNVVSYEDILKEYDGGVLSVASPTKHDLYKTLKKVVPEVVNKLNEDNLSVVSIPKGRNTDYQYVGENIDPFKNMKFKAVLKERYDCIDRAIKDKTPIRFTYWPFDRGKMDLVFHPHLLKTYNGRMFSIGVSDKDGKEPMRRYVIALDRIYGEILGGHSTDIYKPALPNEYSYLSHLVGVTLEEGAELTTITLRAHDKYTFGRLTTKPLHDSQRTICTPSWKEGRGYGDIELTVYPNKELVGQILSYGSMLEVVEPENFRCQIKNVIMNSLVQYQ